MRKYVGKIGGCLVSVCLAIAALFSLGIAAAAAQTSAIKKPHVETPQDSYSFESVSEGTKVTYDFVIKNSGSADLVIQKVIPACGCTVSRVQPETIPPGAAGTLHVELDTSGFEGEKTKLIRVLTNDPDAPSLTFSLKGRIESEVVAHPARVSFDALIKGSAAEAATREFTVSARPGCACRLGEVRTFSKLLAVRELSADARSKKIAVTVLPDAPVGELRERVLIGISGSRSRSISVPVFASIVGELSVSPSTLSMGLLVGTQPIERSVKFENLGAAEVIPTEVRCNHPALTAALVEIKRGRQYVVKVRLDPALVRGLDDFRSVVSVVTSKETLPITVYGALPPRG